MKSRAKSVHRALKELGRYFLRNGYVRRQNSLRVEADGFRLYKKGDEVRLVANSAPELVEIRRLLVLAGFRAGRPFEKGRQFRQPLYGREQVAAFLAAMAEVGGVSPRKSPARAGLGRRGRLAG